MKYRISTMLIVLIILTSYEIVRLLDIKPGIPLSLAILLSLLVIEINRIVQRANRR